MTRELPYYYNADANEDAGDAAYRVASGVARVARAGAYVTGGALIASNGSPAPQNESHNSRIAGWSTADPHPDVPSPVVTYPDPSPDSVPPDLGTSVPAAPGLPEQQGTDAIPGFQWPFTESAPPPSVGDLSVVPGSSGEANPQWTPESDGQIFPGSGTFMPEFGAGQGYSVPGLNPASAPAGGPGPHEPGHFGEFDGADRFDYSHSAGMLPGQGLGLPGTNGLHIPGMNGFGPGGFGSGGVESGDGSDAGLPAGGHGAAFDGVGDGAGFGVWLDVDSTFEAHIGADGVWVYAESTVQLSVGDVGDQIDNFGHLLGDGFQQIPGTTGQGGHAVDPAADRLGHGVSDGSVIGSTSAASGQSSATHAAGSAAAIRTVGHARTAGDSGRDVGPRRPVGVPGPAESRPDNECGRTPINFADSGSAAMPAPAAAPAPVLAQPVAATPWQTTVQPEVASHPVANVFAAHPGPSPLTAPALAGPAWFHDRPQPLNRISDLPGREARTPRIRRDPTSGPRRSRHTPAPPPLRAPATPRCRAAGTRRGPRPARQVTTASPCPATSPAISPPCTPRPR